MNHRYIFPEYGCSNNTKALSVGGSWRHRKYNSCAEFMRLLGCRTCTAVGLPHVFMRVVHIIISGLVILRNAVYSLHSEIRSPKILSTSDAIVFRKCLILLSSTFIHMCKPKCQHLMITKQCLIFNKLNIYCGLFWKSVRDVAEVWLLKCNPPVAGHARAPLILTPCCDQSYWSLHSD